MKYEVQFREEAQRDMFPGYRWYENRQKGLGKDFIREIEAAVNHLKQNPEAFSENKKGFREFPLRKFPYLMIFRIKEITVTVFAVFHTNLNPNKKPLA